MALAAAVAATIAPALALALLLAATALLLLLLAAARLAAVAAALRVLGRCILLGRRIGQLRAGAAGAWGRPSATASPPFSLFSFSDTGKPRWAPLGVKLEGRMGMKRETERNRSDALI